MAAKTGFRVLLGLLAMNAVLIAAHVAARLREAGEMWRIDREFAAGEIAEYLLLAGAIAVVFAKAVRWRAPALHAVWIVLALLLADNALACHERAGEWFAARVEYDPPTNLRTQDLGELAFLAGLLAVVVALLLPAWSRADRALRDALRPVLYLLAVLAGFGVVFDMIHVLLPRGSVVAGLAGVVEDGGELVTVTVLAWWCATRLIRPPSDGARAGARGNRPVCGVARGWRCPPGPGSG